MSSTILEKTPLTQGPTQNMTTIFAPATVSNVACGFDVLGFAVDGPGDLVSAELLDQPGIQILSIDGDDGRLPKSCESNTAGVAARTLLDRCGRSGVGIGLRISKRMPLASGLGSSAASAVAAALAVDQLLGLGASRRDILASALEGERMACGSAHADNAAPCLYGGFVLVRGGEVIELPVPDGLACALVRPHVEVKTGVARKLLGDSVPLKTAVSQWANLAGFITALFRSDFDLMASTLVDHVAEPKRAGLVPGFHAVQAAAKASGALGCSLSGSGPTIFALCTDLARAEKVAAAMAAALEQRKIPHDRMVSVVGARGAHVSSRS